MLGEDPLAAGSIDRDDVARFDRLGDAWWDEAGPMAMLHIVNPVRLRYLRDLIERHRTAARAKAP